MKKKFHNDFIVYGLVTTMMYGISISFAWFFVLQDLYFLLSNYQFHYLKEMILLGVGGMLYIIPISYAIEFFTKKRGNKK